jgi:hypothetical protein
VAHLREPPIRRHETRDHRRNQLGRLDGLPIFAAQDFRIGEEIAMKGSGQLYRNLHRLVVFERTEF